MLKRILIPLDGSEAAESVLPAVEPILLREGATAFLVRALWCPLAKDPHYASILGELEKDALHYLAEMRRRLESKNVAVEVRLVHGDPARTILSVAREESVDLIAMTTHGRTGMTRFLLGSVADKVLHHAKVPVMAVRGPGGLPKAQSLKPFRNLLVPVDGTPESETVLRAAGELAKLYSSKVTILHVVEPLYLEPHLLALVRSAERSEEAIRRLTDLAAGLRAEGVDALAFTRFGDPSAEILKFTEENSVDVICMATHGRTGVPRWMMGSVAERLVRHAGVPIFLVRRPKNAEKTAEPAAKIA